MVQIRQWQDSMQGLSKRPAHMARASKASYKMLGPDDFYIENGLMVLTKSYHLKRGYCCKNTCRHCPYELGAKENNATK